MAKSPFSIRGLMLDPARQTERHEFYFDLLPLMARWGFNTLWWHFVDDEGFALKLDGHPELASPFAFSKAQMRSLIRAAADLGIDIVPEVETLGHTLSITRLPRYRHLFNGRLRAHNAICPSHPQTLDLMAEIIPEVAELFPSPCFHAGLDESDLSGCQRCSRAGRGKAPYWVFARHALSMHRLISACGKRMVMWADPVEKHPELLDILPRDIVMAHWHYGQVDRRHIEPSLRAGFNVVCVPAISGDILQTGAGNIQNTDDMADLARRYSSKGVVGVVNSWWESFRVLRDANLFGLAYTGQAFQHGRAADKVRFARKFAKDFFGLDNAQVAQSLWTLHTLMPTRMEMKALLFDAATDIHQALLLAAKEGHAQKLAAAAEVAENLQAARKKVKDHAGAYGAYVLSAQILHAAFNHAAKLAEAYRLLAKAADNHDGGAPRKETVAFMGQIVEILRGLQGPLDRAARAAATEWDRTRFKADPKKTNRSELMGFRRARAVLPMLDRCRQYNKLLTAGLKRAIGRFERGGPFPAGM